MSMRQSRRSAKAEKATVYADLPAMMVDLAAALQPPERLLPSQAAEKYRMLQIPGAYNGPWLNKTTPYMVEPMDVLVNGYLIAQGEVVVVNDKFGIRLTDIVTPSERMRRLSKAA